MFAPTPVMLPRGDPARIIVQAAGQALSADETVSAPETVPPELEKIGSPVAAPARSCHPLLT